MNDAEFEKLQKRIKDIADVWLPLLGLDDWMWELKFFREPCNGDTEAQIIDMQCKTDWAYHYFHMNIYAQSCYEMDDKDLTYSFLHECAHVFLNETERRKPTRADDNHQEHAATMLGLAFQRIGANAQMALARAESPAQPADSSGRPDGP